MRKITVTVEVPEDYPHQVDKPDRQVLRGHLTDAFRAALLRNNDPEHLRDLPLSLNTTGWIA